MNNPFETIDARLSNIENLLLDIKHTELSQRAAPDVGQIEVAEEVTGLARPTIYAKVAAREIPHSKKNGRLYFSRSELISWIKQGQRRTATEIRDEVDQVSNHS